LKFPIYNRDIYLITCIYLLTPRCRTNQHHVFTHGFVICVYVSVQICCFMVGNLVFWEFLVFGLIIFGLLDTRRWIKSKNTLRLMLIQNV
jgi:hypothetical protein